MKRFTCRCYEVKIEKSEKSAVTRNRIPGLSRQFSYTELSQLDNHCNYILHRSYSVTHLAAAQPVSLQLHLGSTGKFYLSGEYTGYETKARNCIRFYNEKNTQYGFPGTYCLHMLLIFSRCGDSKSVRRLIMLKDSIPVSLLSS